MARRLAVGLLSLFVVLAGLTAFEKWPETGWARPGGGQNYRAPSYSPPPRSYSPPPRSYSPPPRSSPSHNYSPGPSYPASRSYDRGPTTVYVPTGGGYSSSSDGFGSALVVGFFILAVIIIIIWLRARSRQPQRGTIAVDRELQDQGLTALRANDPGFDPAQFVERTKSVVAKVNEAWLKGDMGPARRVISDGVYVRFTTQLGLLKADGLRNLMVDWRVVAAELLGADADALWDTVHVKIVGEARDADVPLGLAEAAAEKKARGAELAQYQEVWSFVRRRGKRSKQGVPALEGHCPSCGADLPLSEVVKCEYCQALINSGEHDWVLAEITQPEEWRAAPAVGQLPGLEELRARDPSVSRQELEDRGSVVFWKWIEARSSGNKDKLARFCIRPPSDPAVAAELDLAAARLRQVAVGSAELAVVETQDELDLAIVEIRWSASVNGAEPNTFQNAFVLGRHSEARSKRGLSSLDCPVCGGQLAKSDETTCPYCSSTLSGGKHEWALLSVMRAELPQGGEEES